MMQPYSGYTPPAYPPPIPVDDPSAGMAVLEMVIKAGMLGLFLAFVLLMLVVLLRQFLLCRFFGNRFVSFQADFMSNSKLGIHGSRTPCGYTCQRRRAHRSECSRTTCPRSMLKLASY